jgi:hypothetical protein
VRSNNLSIAALAILPLLPFAISAQDQGSAIQKKLDSTYQLTKITDDKSDIVTAGSVLVLHKDGLLMLAASSTANPCMNTYKGGKISPNSACKLGDRIRSIKFPLGGLGDKAPASRTFVAGEKFWLTKIDVRTNGKDPGVVLDFFTDAISDVRYAGRLTIQFGTASPTPENALKTVSEVITVQPSDDDKKQPEPATPSQPSAPTAPPPAPVVTEAAPPPIAPPPPPPPDPVQIAEGQTPDQVKAAMGPPLKQFTTGAKEVYVYKDVKITFVNGKVKDIQ